MSCPTDIYDQTSVVPAVRDTVSCLCGLRLLILTFDLLMHQEDSVQIPVETSSRSPIHLNYTRKDVCDSINKTTQPVFPTHLKIWGHWAVFKKAYKEVENRRRSRSCVLCLAVCVLNVFCVYRAYIRLSLVSRFFLFSFRRLDSTIESRSTLSLPSLFSHTRVVVCFRFSDSQWHSFFSLCIQLHLSVSESFPSVPVVLSFFLKNDSSFYALVCPLHSQTCFFFKCDCNNLNSNRWK